MRIHFQEKPWDLYLAIGYTLGMAGILLVVGVGNLAAILLVLFVPGYVLVAALFPSHKEIDWIERIALGIGLSIAIVPLLGLALNFTPLGIRFAPIIAFIAAFTGGVGVLAYWRRLLVPPTERLSLTLDLALPTWKQESLLDKALTTALAGSIVLAGGVLVYAVTAPRPGERFTVFYILDRNDTTTDYPTRLNVSEAGTVIIGVENHEFSRVNYTARVDLVGGVVTNVSGSPRFVEQNRTDLDWFNTTLDNERNWTQAYTFSIAYAGIWKVQFLLFRDNVFDLANPYRNLHLFVNVTGPGSAPAQASGASDPEQPLLSSYLTATRDASVAGAVARRTR